MHTTADDPSVYREEEEVQEWKEKDPIHRFRKYLISNEILVEDDVDKLAKEIEKQIEQAWKDANCEFKGEVYAVNPKADEIAGQPFYTHIADCPQSLVAAGSI